MCKAEFVDTLHTTFYARLISYFTCCFVIDQERTFLVLGSKFKVTTGHYRKGLYTLIAKGYTPPYEALIFFCLLQVKVKITNIDESPLRSTSCIDFDYGLIFLPDQI